MHRCVLACLLLAGASGCGDRSHPVPAAASAGSGDQIEWQGVSGCADCDRIQTDLVLEQATGAQRYTLVETYALGDGSTRFVERGHWQRRGALLELHGDGASLRTYALLDDGRLQLRDRHGDPLPRALGDALIPVAIADGP